MGVKSKIEWTDYTWNYVRGCVEVSPGCKFCYAKSLSARNPKTLGSWGVEMGGGVRILGADKYLGVVANEGAGESNPYQWNNFERAVRSVWLARANGVSTEALETVYGRRLKKLVQTIEDRGLSNRWRVPIVFVASMADVFEDWQGVLTRDGSMVFAENPEDPSTWNTDGKGVVLTFDHARDYAMRVASRCKNLAWMYLTKRIERVPDDFEFPHGMDTILATTVENQDYVHRIDSLRRFQGICRLAISFEPLIGPIDEKVDLTGIDQVIVGGESGSNRIMDWSWVDPIFKAARRDGAAFFMKQGSESEDREGFKEIRTFPTHLRVREYPDFLWKDYGSVLDKNLEACPEKPQG